MYWIIGAICIVEMGVRNNGLIKNCLTSKEIVSCILDVYVLSPPKTLALGMQSPKA
jgi:hypothetical protein